MLVCRLWLNVIHPIALPDTVHITRESAIHKLGQALESQCSNKAQIKDLVIHSVGLSEEVLGSYQDCFPKVRSLYLEGCCYIVILSEKNTQRKEKLMSWIADIEALEFRCNLPLDKCLLTGGTHSALKTLVVIAASRTDIDVLANAPNLTSLTLGNISISISYLEKIHSNLLFLKSLELENIYLEPLDTLEAIPEMVTPSEVVTTLFITTLHNDANKETGWILKYLGYIRRKYTNLVEFRFLIGSLKPVSNLNEEKIFRNEMLPLIKHIGSKARLVEIDCFCMLSQLLELMNSAGFRAECLKLSSTCSNSKASGWIFLNPHSFIGDLTINVNSSRWIPYFSSLMSSIKTLIIKGNSNFQYHGSRPNSTICLKNILGTCSSSLSTLKIEKFGIDAPPSICPSYSLTKLQIFSHCISPAAWDFIARSLPKLRYLEVDFNIHGVPEMMARNVELGSINLYRLDLHLKPQTYLKIKTNMDNRTRYFYIPHQGVSGINWKMANHRCIWGTLGQTTHEEAMTHSHKMIYLEFNSVQLLYINNMVAN
jgi:hypothetical protein